MVLVSLAILGAVIIVAFLTWAVLK